MNLTDLVPAPNAEKVNKLAKRVFGYALDLDNLSEAKAERLHKNLSSQMNIYESKLGSASQTRTKYYEMKIALEALSKHIAEKKAKPDYIDIDGDGDKEESMKKAAKDKKEKTNEYGPRPNRGKAGKAGKSSGAIRRSGGMAGNMSEEMGHADSPKKRKARMQAAKKGSMKQGGYMEESVVTEGAIEGSELIMAAKSMVDKYDAMIQDVGEMLNEQLTPLVDKIRDEMGSDVAEQYLATMTDALNATMAGMKQDRMVADDASRILTGEAPAAPMGEPMPAEGDIAPDEMAMEPIEDEFDVAPAAQGGEEAPVGREKRA